MAWHSESTDCKGPITYTYMHTLFDSLNTQRMFCIKVTYNSLKTDEH